MSDYNYSICATFPLRNRPDRLMFFRLADFNAYSHEFFHVEPTPDYNEINPLIIGANPAEVSANLTQVRKWKYEEDSDYDKQRTLSWRHDVEIFEVIYIPELRDVEYTNTAKIRNVLTQGFTLPDNTCENLLLVIGETCSRIAAVYCPKYKLKSNRNLFSFSDDISDMLHATHFLFEYDIRKTDIIDTEKVGITGDDGRAVPTRYFYRFTQLPESSVKFHLYGIDAYIPQYISKHLRSQKGSLGISNTDIRKIADTIRTILSDTHDAAEFLAITGYDVESIERALEYYGSAIYTDLLSRDDIDEIVRSYLFRSAKIKDACLETARKEWLVVQDEEKSKLSSEIFSLHDEISVLRQKLNDIGGEIQSQQGMSSELSRQIFDKEKQLKKLNEDIAQELDLFKNNLAHSAVFETIFNNIPAGSNNPNSFFAFKLPFSVIDADEVIACDDDFEDALSDNLESVGYASKKSVDIAQLISFCLINKLPIITPTRSEELSRCISASLSGDYTVAIDLSSGCSNICEFISALETYCDIAKPTVVMISGVFDGYSLCMFNALLNYIRTSPKIILPILPLDGVDPAMLATSVWENAIFLDDDAVIGFASPNTLKKYVFQSLDEHNYRRENLLEAHKTFKDFSEIISKRSDILLSKLAFDIRLPIEKHWMLLQQICVIATSSDRNEDLLKLLKKLHLSEDIQRTIKNYM